MFLILMMVANLNTALFLLFQVFDRDLVFSNFKIFSNVHVLILAFSKFFSPSTHLS